MGSPRGAQCRGGGRCDAGCGQAGREDPVVAVAAVPCLVLQLMDRRLSGCEGRLDAGGGTLGHA